jgi:aprataxin
MMPSPSSSIPQLKILRAYAKLDDASLVATLPPTVYYSHTRHTLTIFDAYPKALFHFLVLPRLRTSPSTSSTTSTTTTTPAEHGEGEGDSEAKVVADNTADLTSLRTLLRRPLQRAAAAAASDTDAANTNTEIDPDARARAKGTLSVLSDEAMRLQSQIEREMQTHYGFKWSIWIGFHAIPSME